MEQRKLGNRNGKKNSSMGNSNDKLAKSHLKELNMVAKEKT